jgi:dihydrofolate reductase
MNDPKISVIAAYGHDHELGGDGELLWHLPDDFKWFVERTASHPLIMGRKTMQNLKKPLRNRRNIVVTRNQTAVVDGFEYAPDIDTAISMAAETDRDEIFVIGGGQIYEQTVPRADRLYLTKVHANFDEADTFFPEVRLRDYRMTYFKQHGQDERHFFPFAFFIYEKKK